MHDDHRPLPPFPTRRSSDLETRGSSMRVPTRARARRYLAASTSRLYPRTARAYQALSIRARSSAASGGSGVNPSSARSEEHTSELQSQSNLVCRLLLEKKNE